MPRVGAFLVTAVPVLLALVGCHAPYSRTGLETMQAQPDGSLDRAPRDAREVAELAGEAFGCDAEAVTVQKASSHLFQANGCGKTATFECFRAKGFECRISEGPSEIWPSHADASSSPPPTSELAPFDAAEARRILSSIAYGDCGGGGEAKLQLTFTPDGSAHDATIVGEAFDPSTRACILQRFSAVHVTPFGGPPKTVAWRVALPNAQ